MAMPIVHTDDADAFASWEITDRQGQDLDWANPKIAIDEGIYLAAAWQGSPGPIREIRLPMPLALSLDPGSHEAHLEVPNGNNFTIGVVYVRAR